MTCTGFVSVANDSGKCCEMVKSQWMKSTQQLEEMACSRYYTSPNLPLHMALLREIHQGNGSRFLSLPAILTSPYQRDGVSTSSYLQKSHRGARRQGHEAQNGSDNGAEFAWLECWRPVGMHRKREIRRRRRESCGSKALPVHVQLLAHESAYDTALRSCMHFFFLKLIHTYRRAVEMCSDAQPGLKDLNRNFGTTPPTLWIQERQPTSSRHIIHTLIFHQSRAPSASR
jgi:hypothetical protein